MDRQNRNDKSCDIFLTYIGAYLLSYILAHFHIYAASGVVLMAEAVLLYLHYHKKTGHIINCSGLYSLSLVGGQGISCLKLSYLQTDWAPMTWICFFIAYTGFYTGMRICQSGKDCGLLKEKTEGIRRFFAGRSFSNRRLLLANIILALLSCTALAAEAALLGYIPFFVRGVPHAYSAFHISGVHYFTVSCVLCPAISMIWFMRRKNDHSSDRSCHLGSAAAMIAALSGFLIPVLCVSRFQLTFAFMLCVYAWLVVHESRRSIDRKTLLKIICICIPVLASAYIVLTIARSHDAEYLKGIFEMKKDYPVVFSHFYIYIANNFDNFDCLVKNLAKHTFGLRQLYPLWAFTGLKFKFPQLVVYEYFVTKKELGTLTLFYDAYYDFGVVGVALFSLIMGMAAHILEKISFHRAGALAVMLYSQFAIYMSLSFFTTWFSNPTTWFYIGMTVMVCLLSYEKAAKAGDI